MVVVSTEAILQLAWTFFCATAIFAVLVCLFSYVEDQFPVTKTSTFAKLVIVVAGVVVLICVIAWLMKTPIL